jgi:4-hydroxy-tetrahydrodipicolinate reductase
MRLAVIGAGGRMGAAVIRLAREAGDIELVGACDGSNSQWVGRDAGEIAHVGNWGVAVTVDVASALLGADVCIDFSSPSAAIQVSHAAAREGVAWVCGTTGLNDAALKALDEASQVIPVLWAANMSLGIQILCDLVQDAIRRLGLGFDVEIVETHHRKKADAPSGTALRLSEAAKQARNNLTELYGREGQPGPRTDEEMAVLAVRGGDVIGDHTVHLLGPGERLELTHRSTNRDLFAHGALRAARFLVGKGPGKYSIADMLHAAPAPHLH